jgi:hypothetical protein
MPFDVVVGIDLNLHHFFPLAMRLNVGQIRRT